MNFNAKTKGINWRKIIPVVIMLCVAGYLALQNDKKEGQGNNDNDYSVTFDGDNNGGSGGNNGSGSGDYSINFDGGGNNGSSQTQSSDPLRAKTFDLATVNSAGFAIRETGRDVYTSPAGLVYKMGPRREHRIDHVLRHSADQPDRQGSHGVFDGNTTEILKMLDEAYVKIKNNSRDVRTEDANSEYGDRVAYTINFKRRIGYKGGQSGGRSGNPQLKILKLILQNENVVISAFPYR